MFSDNLYIGAEYISIIKVTLCILQQTQLLQDAKRMYIMMLIVSGVIITFLYKCVARKLDFVLSKLQISI